MARRKIIAGNWKMYKKHDEAVELVKGLINGKGDIKGREMAIFVPAVHAREAASLTAGKGIDVGMQNMYTKSEGAFTGENSPVMVKDAGCRYILIGHSERRHVFGEKDELLNEKVKAAYEFGLEPMLCIGELLEEYEAGKSKEVCKNQLVADLKGITADQMKVMTIAYEPVWAIGTGKVATPEIAQSVHAYVRSVLADLYGKEIADMVPVLYGGSAKPENAAGLLSQPDIDGLLVGGASLKADSFIAIAKA
ncbi:MAG TPA: triose-phosphate isomerase [Spirochaetota bacterium]|nr:triose-phosphate isomerase [Spirochaetota bacterium]